MVTAPIFFVDGANRLSPGHHTWRLTCGPAGNRTATGKVCPRRQERRPTNYSTGTPHGDSTHLHRFPVMCGNRRSHETTGTARADWRWGVRGCRCHGPFQRKSGGSKAPYPARKASKRHILESRQLPTTSQHLPTSLARLFPKEI